MIHNRTNLLCPQKRSASANIEILNQEDLLVWLGWASNPIKKNNPNSLFFWQDATMVVQNYGIWPDIAMVRTG